MLMKNNVRWARDLLWAIGSITSSVIASSTSSPRGVVTWLPWFGSTILTLLSTISKSSSLPMLAITSGFIEREENPNLKF